MVRSKAAARSNRIRTKGVEHESGALEGVGHNAMCARNAPSLRVT